MTLEQFAAAQRATPKELRQASRDALNEMGFQLRDLMIAQVQSDMKVRNKGLARKFIRVQTTKAVWIEQQRVVVGSISSDRFTGWKEQEFGEEAKRDRTMALFARGGSADRQVQQRNRLTQPPLTADQAGIGGSNGNRTIGLLAYAARTGYQGLIKLDGTFHGDIVRLVPGKFYKARGGRKKADLPMFKTVQHHKRFTPVRHTWREESVKKLLTGTSVQTLWKSKLSDAIKRSHGVGEHH